MDFCLTDDHLDLRDGIRAFLQDRFPLEAVAGRENTQRVVDPATWRGLAEMGVFSMADHGLDARAAAIVFEELGRFLVPGPLVGTCIGAPLLGVDGGSMMIGIFEPSNAVAVVEHADQVDTLLWFDDNRLCLVDPETLGLKALSRPVDALSPVFETEVTTPDAKIINTGEQASRSRAKAVVLTASLAVGVAAMATDVANEYAKQREQFGRPVGSFQAVKHLLADMLVRVEVARAAVHAASCALDGVSEDDLYRAASVAKILAGEAALFCGKTGIQVHGGMGFTWEVHAQRFWKRAVVLEVTLGDADHHAELVAATLVGG